MFVREIKLSGEQIWHQSKYKQLLQVMQRKLLHLELF